MNTNDKRAKYEEFLNEVMGNTVQKDKGGFFSKNKMMGKTVFNKNGKRLRFGIIYEEPIYHDFSYTERHTNQYEIRVKSVEAYEIKDKEKSKNNYTRWWISTSTDLDKDMYIVDDEGKKVYKNEELTKKLKQLQNDLKTKEKEYSKEN